MDTPELDLTEATEAAARAEFERLPGRNWDRLGPALQHSYREHVLPIVAAAAPAIARQAWEIGHRDADATYQRPNPWSDKS